MNVTELSEKEMKSIDGGRGWPYIVGYIVSEILNGLQTDCSEVSCQ